MSTLMRTIVLSLTLLGLASQFVTGAKTPPTPFSVVADLATDLSENNGQSALTAFDSSMKDYGAIEQNIVAMVAQTKIVCAIDVVEDSDKDGIHRLSLDWYMTLTLQNDSTRTEQRREQITVEMRQIKGKWKITSMSPLSILNPVNVV
jgi:hypothetical protein